MLIDRYAFRHSSISAGSVAAFERAVTAIAAHRPAAADLDLALQSDPQHVGSLALKGLAGVLLASETAMHHSRSLVPVTQAALRAAASGGTNSERALVDALALAANGKLMAAAKRLESQLADQPRDLLAIKLAHALRFMSGDKAAMLATTSSVLPDWSDTTPGFGFVLGCHAFSLEEMGQFTQAEIAGRTAVAHAPSDVWALHAVAHVMEMGGRLQEGIDWLQPTVGQWSQCASFGGHLAWHFALFQLSSGDHPSALHVFDTFMQTAATCDFREVANATSLLWRLEQEGIDVGDRWHSVGSVAYERRQDTTYVFGALHNLLALIGSNRIDAARDLVGALQGSATSSETDQNEVAGKVGFELSQVLLDMAEHRQSRTPLAALGRRLQRLGGSVAQQDVFLRTLMLIAADSGDELSTAKLKSLRSSQRQADNFIRSFDAMRRCRQARQCRIQVA